MIWKQRGGGGGGGLVVWESWEMGAAMTWALETPAAAVVILLQR